MARSVSELHKAYKARGGKKSFADFRKATVAKVRKAQTPAKSAKAKAKATKRKSKNLRPTARTHYKV